MTFQTFKNHYYIFLHVLIEKLTVKHLQETLTHEYVLV